MFKNTLASVLLFFALLSISATAKADPPDPVPPTPPLALTR